MLCQIKSVPQILKFNFLMFPFTLLLQKNKHNFFNTFLKPALGGIVFFDYIKAKNKEKQKKVICSLTKSFLPFLRGVKKNRFLFFEISFFLLFFKIKRTFLQIKKYSFLRPLRFF